MQESTAHLKQSLEQAKREQEHPEDDGQSSQFQCGCGLAGDRKLVVGRKHEVGGGKKTTSEVSAHEKIKTCDSCSQAFANQIFFCACKFFHTHYIQCNAAYATTKQNQ